MPTTSCTLPLNINCAPYIRYYIVWNYNLEHQNKPTIKYGCTTVQIRVRFLMTFTSIYLAVFILQFCRQASAANKQNFAQIQERWYVVLQRPTTPSAVHLCGGGFMLQQDNEAKCASKLSNNSKIKVDQAQTLQFSSAWALLPWRAKGEY